MVLFIRNRLIEEKAPFSATGLTVSYTVYDESRNSFATGSATEISATAVFWASFTPDTVGDWTLYIYCASTGERHTFHYLVYDSVDSGNLAHNITTTDDTIETLVVEVANAKVYALSAYFDLDVLETAAEGGTITIKAYNKIDGTNYSDKPIAKIDYNIGASSVYPNLEASRLNGYTKFTIQCSGNVSTTRTISYRYIYEDLGD
jgi:hypothetical protein